MNQNILWKCLMSLVEDQSWTRNEFLEILRMYFVNDSKSGHDEGLKALVEWLIRWNYGLKVTIEVPKKEGSK